MWRCACGFENSNDDARVCAALGCGLTRRLRTIAFINEAGVSGVDTTGIGPDRERLVLAREVEAEIAQLRADLARERTETAREREIAARAWAVLRGQEWTQTHEAGDLLVAAEAVMADFVRRGA